MTRPIAFPPKSRLAFGKMHVLLIAGALVLVTVYLGPNAVAEKSVAIPAPSAKVLF